MTAKTVNYTAEMVAEMTEAYKANPTKDTVAALATAFGKTTKAIVAKLAQLGIYQKADKATAAAVGITKADLAAQVAAKFGGDEKMVADLQKLTKATLVALV